MLDLDNEEASIVVVGDLNPRIFHPDWFGANDLLREKEVARSLECENFLVASQVAQFTADWLEIQVTTGRFLAKTCNPAKFTPLRDLVLSTFQLLNQTPVRLLGLNRALVFQAESKSQWNAVGDALAPKGPWMGIVDGPGMLEVHMECEPRVETADFLRVKVRPTHSDPERGVRLDFNEQHGGESPSADYFTEIIEREWDRALDHFRRVADHVLDHALRDAGEEDGE